MARLVQLMAATRPRDVGARVLQRVATDRANGETVVASLHHQTGPLRRPTSPACNPAGNGAC
eukprot:472574-Lingulodinium_polyedra.AAC.1